MIRELALLLLIVISLQVLIRFTLYEGFTTIKRVDDRKEWEQLSDDQLIELLAISIASFTSVYIIDEKSDPESKETVKDIISIARPIYLREDTKIYRNQSDIDSFKNKILNKASENKNLSVLFNVMILYQKEGLKLFKKTINAEQNDRSILPAIQDEVKALAKKGISEIRRRMPNFPFNPDIKKAAPELFAETPKPSASECKRYFKCSSIYAA
jgi:hypothetical protein